MWMFGCISECVNQGGRGVRDQKQKRGMLQKGAAGDAHEEDLK